MYYGTRSGFEAWRKREAAATLPGPCDAFSAGIITLLDCGLGETDIRLGGTLGQGSGGIVYCAQESATGQTVALKEIEWSPDALEGRKGSLRSAQIECDVGKRLTEACPAHVVHTRACGQNSGGEQARFYIVMDLAEGDMQAMVQHAIGPKAVEMSIQLVEAIECQHAAGVANNDLAVGNALLKGGRPVLSDFGEITQKHEPNFYTACKVHWRGLFRRFLRPLNGWTEESGKAGFGKAGFARQHIEPLFEPKADFDETMDTVVPTKLKDLLQSR